MSSDAALAREASRAFATPKKWAAAPIAVQPLGEVDRAQLSLLDDLLARSFGAATVILPPVAVPSAALDEARGQHDADLLLELVFERLPERCLRIVGVTELDLFIEGRTFVFGYAHLVDGMALYSTHRLVEPFYGRPPRRVLTAERVRRAVVHELGHTFGVPHCPRSGCVMHAVTHVETLDALSPRYCSDCRARVRAGLAVPPWSGQGRWERGRALLRRRRWPAAVAELEHATRCAPREPRYHHNLGIARLGAGDSAGARAALSRALELGGAVRCLPRRQLNVADI